MSSNIQCGHKIAYIFPDSDFLSSASCSKIFWKISIKFSRSIIFTFSHFKPFIILNALLSGADMNQKSPEQNPIICITEDCKYHNPSHLSQCDLKVVCLRKGICRYYAQGKLEDRTDLPGKDYFKFIAQLEADQGNISGDPHGK
jgi:hypothetical protein